MGGGWCGGGEVEYLPIYEIIQTDSPNTSFVNHGICTIGPIF